VTTEVGTNVKGNALFSIFARFQFYSDNLIDATNIDIFNVTFG
jgi:hypothetical protein